MSVPILDQESTVLGVIQISRKGIDPKFTQDFSREDLHDLEVAAGVLAVVTGDAGELTTILTR